jgi:hypothetical protein
MKLIKIIFLILAGSNLLAQTPSACTTSPSVPTQVVMSVYLSSLLCQSTELFKGGQLSNPIELQKGRNQFYFTCTTAKGTCEMQSKWITVN